MAVDDVDVILFELGLRLFYGVQKLQKLHKSLCRFGVFHVPIFSVDGGCLPGVKRRRGYPCKSQSP